MWIYKIEWYIRALRWLYENRTWKNTRQKWKAFDRAMREYETKEQRAVREYLDHWDHWVGL